MRQGYALVRGLAQGLFRLGCGISIHGVENIPESGPIIVASNHRSNYDPPLLGAVVRRELHYFAKEELFRNALLGRFLRYLNAFPVRRGEFDRTALAKCLDVLRQNGALAFFPEGTRAPEDGFLKPKLGLGWVVCLSGAPVIPAYLHGTAQASPRLRGRPGVAVTFGHSIPASELMPEGLRGRELYQAVSDAVVERIRDLSLVFAQDPSPSRGPVYERSVIDDERLR
ncbi:1-acyl-sn-glycerol-3-phosphate acyltransferase [bacterium]|nr:1-acyl-sn-glycerol-3-phosphate acyltransferase [bacterium]MBU1984505.1 1-acyl-sn-glycerol-3-phosphate acyltransferase [bacterium]